MWQDTCGPMSLRWRRAAPSSPPSPRPVRPSLPRQICTSNVIQAGRSLFSSVVVSSPRPTGATKGMAEIAAKVCPHGTARLFPRAALRRSARGGEPIDARARLFTVYNIFPKPALYEPDARDRTAGVRPVSPMYQMRLPRRRQHPHGRDDRGLRRTSPACQDARRDRRRRRPHRGSNALADKCALRRSSKGSAPSMPTPPACPARHLHERGCLPRRAAPIANDSGTRRAPRHVAGRARGRPLSTMRR